MPGHSKAKPSYPFSNQGTGNVSSSGSPSASDPLYPPPSSSSSSSHTSPYRHSPYSDSPSRDLYFPNSPSSSSVHMDRAEGAGQVYGTASSRGGTNSMMSSSSSFVAPLLPSEDRHGSISGSSTRSYQPSAGRSGSRVLMAGEADAVAEKYALPADPALWAEDGPEPDDYLHTPDPKRDRKNDMSRNIFTWRGAENLGCLLVLGLGLFMLFAGYPIITEFTKRQSSTLGSFNLGGINGSGQVPAMIGSHSLIDKDTPQSAYSVKAENGETWELMFSDEFNEDGRTFYPGDDPYWESIDLHAWGTNDLEWYDHRQLSTKDGKLVLELAKIKKNDLDYLGASLQSWNKFCFSGHGRLEASVQLPGRASVYGLWPAFWTMGNLGRVGYGGTLDGLWPYSYDSCDAGTLKNQSLNGVPAIASTSGTDEKFNYELSYMPGQRLSRCTCPDDETHPGPKHPDGTWVGRSAPEIDVFEAQTDSSTREGQVSLSVQWAPFNPHYEWNNATHMRIPDETKAHLNTYQGGVYQQSGSVIGVTDQDCYEIKSNGAVGGCYAVYAYEYQTGSDGYIKWFNDDTLAWAYTDGGMGPVPEADLGNRVVPEEPMYILFNLAISNNFGAIDFEGLEDLWPVHMSVDYIRFYQDPNRKDIGCDPDHHPTAEYIARYADAYVNPNITTWDQMTDNAPLPKNKLLPAGC